MRRRLVPLLLAAVLGGCGSEAADLFALTRSGSGPGARLSLVVNDDGSVRCNGGTPRELPSARLLDARADARDVAMDAHDGRRFPARPGSVLAYRIRTPEGTVAWADTSRPLPSVYFRLAGFARRVSLGVCGLRR